MVAEETMLTIEAVNQRLPLVRTIVRDIMELSRDIAVRKQRLSSLRERYPITGGDDSVYEQEVLQMEAELPRDEVRLDEYVRELHQIGEGSPTRSWGRLIFQVIWMVKRFGYAGRVTSLKCCAGIAVTATRTIGFRSITN